MKIVTYNIQYGLGKDGEFDLARIAGEVSGADIIAFQEVERFWLRSGMTDQVIKLAELLPSYHWVYGGHYDVNASTIDNDGRVVNRRRQHGEMILSRLPILSTRNFLYPKFSALTQHNMQRGLLEAVIETPSGPLRIYTTHLSFLAAPMRSAEITQILEIIARAPNEGGAWSGGHRDPDWIRDAPMPPMPRDVILLGDFNFTPDAEEYSQIVGPTEQPHGRINDAFGFVDAWVAGGHNEMEPCVTAHLDSGLPIGRIDYCFVASWLAGRVRSCEVDHTALGSDHQPVWLDINLETDN